jgi:Ser/Thr protein kinase RdoA (MazF antagonist)
VNAPAPDPAAILAAFPLDPVSITPHAGGHINQSWRVESRTGPFLLQRINPAVFPDGAAVMRNMLLVTRHLEQALRARQVPDPTRHTLRVVPAVDGSPAIRAGDGAWWRLLHFIEDTVTLERVTRPEQAFEAGRAFARFLAFLRDFDGRHLTETIPAFRDTAARVTQLDRAVAADQAGRVASVREDLAALDARRDYAELFPPLIASGALPRRVVHNDAKSGNVLRDAATGEGLAVVDLDTVMPGTALSDVGDLIRSMASPTDEDERDLSRVAVQPILVEGLARGYLSLAGEVVAPEERRHFITAGLVTTYEQAVRFYTDYLDGDRYYRISRPGQNLDRGRAQLKLLMSLEASRAELERIVAAL